MTKSPNLLPTIDFAVGIQRLPEVTFRTKNTTIPDISSSPVKQHTMFNPVNVGGDHVEFSPLDITFLVDEDMKNYISIFDWLTKLNFNKSSSQYSELQGSEFGLYSDINITILNSNKRPNMSFDFINCFPISLSSINLDISQESVEYAEVTATFSYDNFSMKKL